MGTFLSPLNADKEKDGQYKRSGQIVFRVNEFSTFAQGIGQKRLISDSGQCINGLNWRLVLQHFGTDLALFVLCEGDENDKAWSCLASVRKSIVACEFGKNNFVQNTMGFIFHAGSRELGSECFIKFSELMDPNNGWYDGQEDAVTFTADIFVEPPNGMPTNGAFLKDILLVNGETVSVNKYFLAASSKFFEALFFGENAERIPKIQIKDVTDPVPHFERLFATMYPQNKEKVNHCKCELGTVDSTKRWRPRRLLPKRNKFSTIVRSSVSPHRTIDKQTDLYMRFIYCQAKVNGTNVLIHFDSAAHSCFISERFWDICGRTARFNANYKPNDVHRVEGFDGSIMETAGRLEDCMVEIGNFSTSFDFNLIGGEAWQGYDTECLCGLNFLIYTGIRVDFENLCFKFGEHGTWINYLKKWEALTIINHQFVSRNQ